MQLGLFLKVPEILIFLIERKYCVSGDGYFSEFCNSRYFSTCRKSNIDKVNCENFTAREFYDEL